MDTPPIAPASPGEDRRFVIGLVVVAAVLLVMALPALQGRMYMVDDLGDYFQPVKFYFSRCLAQGQETDWCPLLFGGFYLQGDGQAGMYHPLVRLAYTWLPFTTAFNLEVLLPYPLLLLGMFLLLRRWGLPRDASLIGAMTFAFSGFTLLHHVHVNATEVVAHLPFLLLALDYLLRGSTRQAVWAWFWIAMLTASQTLFAYPQYLLFTGIAELAYIASLRGGLAPARRLPALACAILLGVLMGSIQLLPTYEALGLSGRVARSMEFKCSYSLHPGNLIHLLSPYFFADGFVGSGNFHEFGLFDGVLAIASVAWVLLRWRRLGAWRPLASGLLLAAGSALVLALGEYGQLYKLQTMLPLAGVFRCPCRYIMLVHLALAMLTAVAVADLLRLSTGIDDGPRREPRALWLLVALAALAGAGGAAVHCWGSGKLALLTSGPLTQLGGVVLLSAGVALAAATARGWRGAFTALIVLAAGSQAWYGLSFFWQMPPATLAEVCQAAPQPPTEGHRVALVDNRVVFNGVRSTTGYAPLRHQRRCDHTQPVPRQVAGVAGPDAAPLPYVRLVNQTVTSADPARDLNTIDVRTTALVEDALSLPAGPLGAAELVEERPGRLVIRTATDSDQLLIVSESMHPGWEAHLDGQVGRPLRVNGDWLGYVVPAGTHQVEFRFRPWSLAWGARLSVLGLVLTLTLFGTAMLWTSRRASEREMVGRSLSFLRVHMQDPKLPERTSCPQRVGS